MNQIGTFLNQSGMDCTLLMDILLIVFFIGWKVAMYSVFYYQAIKFIYSIVMGVIHVQI